MITLYICYLIIKLTMWLFILLLKIAFWPITLICHLFRKPEKKCRQRTYEDGLWEGLIVSSLFD